MGAVTLGTGPGVISSQPDKYGYDSNGFGGGVSGGGSYRPRQQQGVRFSLVFNFHPVVIVNRAFPYKSMILNIRYNLN